MTSSEFETKALMNSALADADRVLSQADRLPRLFLHDDEPEQKDDGLGLVDFGAGFEIETKVRYVRTAEGARKYGQAIGTPIVTDAISVSMGKPSSGAPKKSSRTKAPAGGRPLSRLKVQPREQNPYADDGWIMVKTDNGDGYYVGYDEDNKAWVATTVDGEWDEVIVDYAKTEEEALDLLNDAIKDDGTLSDEGLKEPGKSFNGSLHSKPTKKPAGDAPDPMRIGGSQKRTATSGEIDAEMERREKDKQYDGSGRPKDDVVLDGSGDGTADYKRGDKVQFDVPGEGKGTGTIVKKNDDDTYTVESAEGNRFPFGKDALKPAPKGAKVDNFGPPKADAGTSANDPNSKPKFDKAKADQERRIGQLESEWQKVREAYFDAPVPDGKGGFVDGEQSGKVKGVGIDDEGPYVLVGSEKKRPAELRKEPTPGKPTPDSWKDTTDETKPGKDLRSAGGYKKGDKVSVLKNTGGGTSLVGATVDRVWQNDNGSKRIDYTLNDGTKGSMSVDNAKDYMSKRTQNTPGTQHWSAESNAPSPETMSRAEIDAEIAAIDKEIEGRDSGSDIVAEGNLRKEALLAAKNPKKSSGKETRPRAMTDRELAEAIAQEEANASPDRDRSLQSALKSERERRNGRQLMTSMKDPESSDGYNMMFADPAKLSDEQLDRVIARMEEFRKTRDGQKSNTVNRHLDLVREKRTRDENNALRERQKQGSQAGAPTGDDIDWSTAKVGDRVMTEWGEGTISGISERSVTFDIDDGNKINLQKGTPGLGRVKKTDSAAPDNSQFGTAAERAEAQSSLSSDAARTEYNAARRRGVSHRMAMDIARRQDPAPAPATPRRTSRLSTPGEGGFKSLEDLQEHFRNFQADPASDNEFRPGQSEAHARRMQKIADDPTLKMSANGRLSMVGKGAGDTTIQDNRTGLLIPFDSSQIRTVKQRKDLMEAWSKVVDENGESIWADAREALRTKVKTSNGFTFPEAMKYEIGKSIMTLKPEQREKMLRDRQVPDLIAMTKKDDELLADYRALLKRRLELMGTDSSEVPEMTRQADALYNEASRRWYDEDYNWVSRLPMDEWTWDERRPSRSMVSDGFADRPVEDLSDVELEQAAHAFLRYTDGSRDSRLSELQGEVDRRFFDGVRKSSVGAQYNGGDSGWTEISEKEQRRVQRYVESAQEMRDESLQDDFQKWSDEVRTALRWNDPEGSEVARRKAEIARRELVRRGIEPVLQSPASAAALGAQGVARRRKADERYDIDGIVYTRWSDGSYTAKPQSGRAVDISEESFEKYTASTGDSQETQQIDVDAVDDTNLSPAAQTMLMAMRGSTVKEIQDALSDLNNSIRRLSATRDKGRGQKETLDRHRVRRDLYEMVLDAQGAAPKG